MAKHMKGKHTGKAVHPDMHAYRAHDGGHGDPHAHPSHAKNNREHGMPEGMSPQGGYEEGPEGENEEQC